MKVMDVMSRNVIAVDPATPIDKAARLMVDHGVSGLPVVDETGRVVGVVSEGDLILRQKPRERSPWWRVFFDDGERLARDYQKTAGTTVGEVMTSPVISVSPDASIETAAHILDARRVRRLPVISDGELVGIVARGDLIKALATPRPKTTHTDPELEAEMLKRLSGEPWSARFAIGVTAEHGIVSLWGVVTTETERAAIETMARSMDGCAAVESHLIVGADVPYAYSV